MTGDVRINEIKYGTRCESLMTIVSVGTGLNAWITAETREQKLENAVSLVLSRSSLMVNEVCFAPRMVTW